MECGHPVSVSVCSEGCVWTRESGRPPGKPAAEFYRDDAVEIDFLTSSVRVRGEAIGLTVSEYKILTTLIERSGHPVPVSELKLRAGVIHSRTHIKNLRIKIELDPKRPELIVTRRGYGYVYEKGESNNAQAL